jgi:hypothetical protein
MGGVTGVMDVGGTCGVGGVKGTTWGSGEVMGAAWGAAEVSKSSNKGAAQGLVV